MPLAEHLRHPIDSFRTAPVGIITTAVGIVGTSEMWDSFNENPSSPKLIYLGASVLFAFLGVKKVRHQFEMREDLEHIINRRGYDSRLADLTIPTYCGRQTMRVVLRDDPVALESYKQRCKNEPARACAWLPHI